VKIKPKFEFFDASHVPTGPGLVASYYSDGQLRKFAYVVDGKDVEWITLKHKKPAGTRENTAQAQDFNANGSMDDYAGRYEHGPFDPGISFGDWVRTEIDAIRRASQGEKVDFFRAFPLT
jgi:hypothetical protein